MDKLALVLASDLTRRLLPPEPRPLPTPPLPLSRGHTALLVASGHLDGVVQPDDEPPHVVRGTTKKVKAIVSTEHIENDDGSVTTKNVSCEIIQLTVRAVGADGVIHAFSTGGE